jgi:hypothetical protein
MEHLFHAASATVERFATAPSGLSIESTTGPLLASGIGGVANDERSG